MGHPKEAARELAAPEREHPALIPRWGRGLVCAGGAFLVRLLVQVIRTPIFGVVEHMPPKYGGGYWEVCLWPLFPLIAVPLASTIWRALRKGAGVP